MGEAPDSTILVQDVAEAEALELPADARLAYVTQTTLSVDETAEIIATLRRRFPQIVGPKKEDICYATSNRQWAVKDLLARDRPPARDRLAQLLELEPARRRRPRGGRAGAPDRRRDRDRRALARREPRRSASRRARPRPSASSTRVCDWFRARGVDDVAAVPDGRRGRRRSGCRSSSAASSSSPRPGPSSPLRPSRSSARRRRPPRATWRASPRGSTPRASSRSASRAGIVSAIRSESSSPDSLRSAFTLPDQLVDAPLAVELLVDVRVERDRDAVLGRDRPAFLPGALDEHLVRPELVPRGAEAPARRAPRTRPRESASRTAPSSRPSFGPSTGRFGLTTSSASTVSKRTSFTRSSSRISVGLRLGARAAPSTTSARSGWLHLEARGLAGLMAERDDTPDVRDLGEELARRARAPPASRRGGRSRARPRTAPRTSTCQRCSARNGITGAITRSAWTSACQSVRSATSSPSQKRRRERRMYQFERSSTKASKARITSTVSHRS